MRYLERLKCKIENKSKDKSISTLNTDIDVPFWLSDDMVSKIDIKIDDSILFPCTKYGIFPYAVLKKISENIIFDLFDERDVLRILQRKFVFCDTQDQNLFIKKIFENDLKRSYKSKIISDFYNEIKFILDMNEDFKKTMESIILSTFYKTNSDFFHIIEKNISDFMSSKNFKEWSEKCKKTISKYIDTSKLCSKQFGEVFTPEWLIKEMISVLPKANKNMIFLDPAAGIGNFSIFLVEKLMKDIEEEILDEEERKKHIIENMIVQCELQVKNSFVNYYILDPENKYNLKIFRGSFLTPDFENINPEFLEKCKEWGINKFDYAIGNPPYNAERGLSNNTTSIYPAFVENSYKISDKVIMITPSRWFGATSSKKHREKMINEYGLKKIKHFDNPNIFEGADIKGGVSFFLIEKNYKGDVEFTFNDRTEKRDLKSKSSVFLYNYDNILEKVNKNKSSSFKSIFKRNGHIQTNDSRIHSENLKESIICLASRDRILKINLDTFSHEQTFLNSHKVVTPLAQGTGYNKIEKFIYLEPGKVANSSYVLFNFNSKDECDGFINLLKLDLIQFLIAIRKTTQSLTSNCFDIPKLDLSKNWTNEDLYNHFNLDEYDRNIIKETIK